MLLVTNTWWPTLMQPVGAPMTTAPPMQVPASPSTQPAIA
jgi:hypothetical protein